MLVLRHGRRNTELRGDAAGTQQARLHAERAGEPEGQHEQESSENHHTRLRFYVFITYPIHWNSSIHSSENEHPVSYAGMCAVF